MATSTASSPAPPPPPPSAAKKGFLRRVLPVLLAANLAVGGYVLLRTSKKEPSEKGDEAAGEVPAAPAATTESTIPVTKPVVAPVKVLPPIAEQEQRELFKWILEEKRKMKPSDQAERKKIDEEKALLKQFIRAKTIPSL